MESNIYSRFIHPSSLNAAGLMPLSREERKRYFATVRLENTNHATLRVAKHWNRSPRGAADALSLEMFKVRLDSALGNLI